MSVEILTEDTNHPLDSVASAVCKQCDDLGAAVLVLASGHKSVLAEFFLGSVTSYCSRHCKVPVVVLH